eukprot:9572433-Alexandrium_andersonii.AAC.1
MGLPRLVYRFAWQGSQQLQVYADTAWAGLSGNPPEHVRRLRLVGCSLDQARVDHPDGSDPELRRGGARRRRKGRQRGLRDPE